MSNPQFQMLHCGIPVVDRYVEGLDIQSHGKERTSFPIILYKIARLRVGVEWTYTGQGFLHGQVFDGENITALAFHSLDESKALEDRVWTEASRNLPVSDLIREIERETAIDALIGCNFTLDDIGRRDLIYLVHNNLGVEEFNEKKEHEKLDIGIYPQFKGCGYFSIRGVKYSIPRLGEDTRILS